MAEVFPNLWYNNAILGATYTLNGGLAETAGYEWANVSDWRDFSEFKWTASASSYAEMTMAASIAVSSLIMWCAASPAGATFTVSAELGASGGGYTTMGTLVIAANSVVPVITTFAQVTVPSGNKIRVTRTTAGSIFTIREIFVGAAFVPERGMFKSVKPPTLSGTIVSDTIISCNGSILGRNTRRVDRAQTLDFAPVTAAWVRASWEPFAAHMQKYACFYQWNPTTYPADLVFGAAEQIQAPEQDSHIPYMHVSMPLRVLS